MAMQQRLEAPVAPGALTTLGEWFGRFIRNAQRARMIKALNQMSDRDLAAVGIARTEIAAHAARLIDPEA